MKDSDLLQQIGRKLVSKEDIADRVADDPERVREVVRGLGAREAAVRYGCAKVLRIISEKRPQAIYPYIDCFVELLDSKSNVLKWTGILLIGNLAAVDRENKIDHILTMYLEPIPGPVLITAANVIVGAARIGSAKPYLAERIAVEIRKVEHGEYKTPECRNVALGHAINSLDRLFDCLEKKQPVIDFIRRQLDNPRSGTRRRAQEVLKKRHYG